MGLAANFQNETMAIGGRCKTFWWHLCVHSCRECKIIPASDVRLWHEILIGILGEGNDERASMKARGSL